MLSTIAITLLTVLFFYELLLLLLPNGHRLHKKQYQCGDCHYLGYTEFIYGYLCCNPKIAHEYYQDRLPIRTDALGKQGIEVIYANPDGKCPHYKKSWFKWFSKWRTKIDYSRFR